MNYGFGHYWGYSRLWIELIILSILVVAFYIRLFIYYHENISMKKLYKYIIGMLLMLVLTFVALYTNGTIGVYESKIESDARKSQKIDENWQVSKSITDSMGSLLFYDTDTDDLTYSIYLNRKGFSFGYFFRSGGNRHEINEGICGFHFDGYGMVLLSMNKANIERIEIDSGQKFKRIDVDSKEPFTVVLPENCGIVTIYDINNNTIPITSVIVND